MSKLRYIPAARRDLLDLWVGIARENPEAADRVVERIEAACAHLRDYPNLGRARPEIGHGARALIVERWLALYKVEPKGVQIVRVVDGARDPCLCQRGAIGSDDGFAALPTAPARP